MIGLIVVAVLAVVIVFGLKKSKKIAAERKVAEEKAAEEKAKATEALWASVNLDQELDNIFAVLEKSSATVSNFEKGLDHFASKAEAPLKREDVLPKMKKALFDRAFDGDNNTVAKAVAVDYFIKDVVKLPMYEKYMRFAIAKEKGDFSGWMGSYVQVLYGIAGRAFTYQFNHKNNNLQPESYQAITPEVFKTIIENNEVLQSYTDSDPFTVDTVRQTWSNTLCKAPLEMVRSSKLGDLLDNEQRIDEMCYLAYTVLPKVGEDSGENASVTEIAVTYNDFLKEMYDRIRHN